MINVCLTKPRHIRYSLVRVVFIAHGISICLCQGLLLYTKWKHGFNESFDKGAEQRDYHFFTQRPTKGMGEHRGNPWKPISPGDTLENKIRKT